MKHSSPEALEGLAHEWDLDDGFLGILRSGTFRPDLGDRLLSLLNSIEVDEDEPLDPEFVRLSWFIPTFMSWQFDRAVERGANETALENQSGYIRERLMELLGTPLSANLALVEPFGPVSRQYVWRETIMRGGRRGEWRDGDRTAGSGVGLPELHRHSMDQRQ